MDFVKNDYISKEVDIDSIIETFSKMFYREPETVYQILIKQAKQLGYDNFCEIELLEKFMFDNHFQNISSSPNTKVNDLNLLEGEYAVLCHNNEKYYLLGIKKGNLFDEDETY